VLRALTKSSESRAALAAELALADGAAGELTAYQAYCQSLLMDLGEGGPPLEGEYGARRLAERIVLAVQAALLLRHAPAFVSTAFVASRLVQAPGGAFGRLPAGADCAAILARALPQPG
jgi:putative acyl-CoA dehydrogenase